LNSAPIRNMSEENPDLSNNEPTVSRGKGNVQEKTKVQTRGSKNPTKEKRIIKTKSRFGEGKKTDLNHKRKRLALEKKGCGKEYICVSVDKRVF